MVVSKVVPRLRYTMEDFCRWTEGDVEAWVREESAGVPILEAELDKNLYAFAEYSGAKINLLGAEDLLVLGVSCKSRDVLIQCLDQVRANEARNKQRRKKADTLWKAFLDCDNDGNGIIEEGELKALVQQTFPATTDAIVGIYYDVILEYCDPEHTGQIRVEKLLQVDHTRLLMQVMSEAEQAEQVEQRFNALDKDQSGMLDHDELRDLIEQSSGDAGPTLKARYYREILADCDSNNDGVITVLEVLRSNCVRQLMKASVATDPTAISPTPDGSVVASSSMTVTSPSTPGSRPLSPSRLRTPTSSRTATPTAMRTMPSSPRLASRPPQHTGVLVRSPRGAKKKAEKKEANGFRPEGVTADDLAEQGEEILEERLHSHHQWQEAAETFLDAAAEHKAEDRMERCGNSYERASDCYRKLGYNAAAAEALKSAADAYKTVDSQKAVECLTEASDLYLVNQRWRLVVLLYGEVVDIAEQEGELENAIDWLLKIAEFCEKDEVDMADRKCKAMQRMTHLYIRLGLWEEARDNAAKNTTFVSNMNERSPGRLAGKYVREALMEALFTALCGLSWADEESLEIIQTYWKSYCESDTRTKEWELLDSILQAVKANRQLTFDGALERWDAKGGAAAPWLQLCFECLKGKLTGLQPTSA